MAFNADHYRQVIANAWAKGPVWEGINDSGKTIYKLTQAMAEEYARIDARALNLLNEVFPDTTLELLDDWERVLGLPDTCTGAATTLQERRDAIISKLLLIGRQDPQFYIEFMAAFGIEITITQFKPFRAGQAVAGDALTNENWLFWWQVNSALYNYKEFKAGQSQAGDALRTWGNAALECLINKYKPAHTQVIFSYT